MKRVLIISDAGGVSEYYRTLAPYMLLQDAGMIDCVVDDGKSPAIINHLDEFAAIVFSRPDRAEHALLLREANWAGVRTILDIDDNLLMVPPSIGVYSAWRERGTGKITTRLWYLKHNIKLADVLTVSTATLGRQLCDGEPFSLRDKGDYLVLPNCIVGGDWVEDDEQLSMSNEQGLVKGDGEVWIGWWGIYNHWDDWRDVATDVETALLSRPKAKLILLGMPELAQLFPRLAELERLVTRPFIYPNQLGEYRALVRQFDVGLAPTADCPFNRSKSDLKLLQYGAAGVPVIASRCTYGAWEGMATIVDGQYGWYRALNGVLSDLETAREQARQLQAVVNERRTYEMRFTDWLAVFR